MHDRTSLPLSDHETQAALRAVSRVLDAARLRTQDVSEAEDLADILTSARRLPRMLTQPVLFRERFRPTLEQLARRYPEFRPVLSEYDCDTTRRRPRRAPKLYEDLWVDCGGGD